ncbi:flagellar motor switch protein FliN, partial [Methylacidiphilum caldifontis]
MPKKASRLTAEEIQALVGGDTEAEAEVEASAEVDVKKVEFAELEVSGDSATHTEPVEFLWDVPMTVEVVLGSTAVTVKDALEIGPGSVVELDRVYGEPVDIMLNGRLVAHGEVVIVGDQFGV